MSIEDQRKLDAGNRTVLAETCLNREFQHVCGKDPFPINNYSWGETHLKGLSEDGQLGEMVRGGNGRGRVEWGARGGGNFAMHLWFLLDLIPIDTASGGQPRAQRISPWGKKRRKGKKIQRQ